MRYFYLTFSIYREVKKLQNFITDYLISHIFEILNIMKISIIILPIIITILSICGGFLITFKNAKYRFIGFILWVCSNILWISFGLIKKDYSMMVLLSVYLIQATIGIINTKPSKGK